MTTRARANGVCPSVVAVTTDLICALDAKSLTFCSLLIAYYNVPWGSTEIQRPASVIRVISLVRRVTTVTGMIIANLALKACS